MAWETSRLERTLTILKGTRNGKPSYTVLPIHTVRTPDGQTYEERNSGFIIAPDLYHFTELVIRDEASYGTLPNYRVNGGKFTTETVQGPSLSSVYPGKDEAE